MKILHIANFGFNKQGAHFYCTDRKISAGLIENGHFVYDFSFRDMARMGTIFKTKKLGAGWANKEILKIIENLEPDLVLIGHSDLMSPLVLKEIKQRYPQTKIAFWYVDWLCDKKKSQFIFNFSPYVDALFCTTGGELLQQFKTITNKVAYIPNMVNRTIESLKQFNCTDFKNDFVFFGTFDKGSLREKFILSLIDSMRNHISCYGIHNNLAVYGSQYLQVLAQSRMGLNFSRRNDITLYSSDRIAQLTGNGLLTFSPKIPDFELLYNEEEIVYFNDFNDLVEKIYFYLENEQAAFDIAKRGWEKSHRSFNSKRITQFMLEVTFDLPLSEDYEWATEVYR